MEARLELHSCRSILKRSKTSYNPPHLNPSGRARQDGAMAKRILLVSFDDRLLIEQRGRLEEHGYAVTSARHVKDAVVDCTSDRFDLFILGRSIPHSIKKDLIETFRAHNSRPILSLWTPGEQILDAVNYLEFSDNLDNFVKSVQTILTREEASSGG